MFTEFDALAILPLCVHQKYMDNWEAITTNFNRKKCTNIYTVYHSPTKDILEDWTYHLLPHFQCSDDTL